MEEFILKGAVGFVLILIWAYLIVFVEWLGIKMGLPEGFLIAGICFSVAAIAWLMCYGTGSLFFDVFLK